MSSKQSEQKTTIEEGFVIRAVKGIYQVVFSDRQLRCSLKARHLKTRLDSTPVAVGDRVLVECPPSGHGVIHQRLERKTVLSRPSIGHQQREQVLVANIDLLIIVTSIVAPPLNTALIDRYLIAAQKGELKPVICLNKIDLASPSEVTAELLPYRMLGYPLLHTSAITGEGIDGLKNIMKNKMSVFSGLSGVGKSSLITAVQPDLHLKLGAVSAKTGKGTHTTSATTLYPLSIGGYVADTPGIRSLSLWQLKPNEVARYFIEMAPLLGQCRFRSCTHLNEPDCAIKQAVATNQVARTRYESYVRIYNTLGSRWE